MGSGKWLAKVYSVQKDIAGIILPLKTENLSRFIEQIQWTKFYSKPIFLATILVLYLISFFPEVGAEENLQTVTSEPTLRLEDLEQRALQNNPTLAQAEAAIRIAEGRRIQAGLYPNPVMGYRGGQLSLRAPSKTSEHMFFLEQSIITAGKLRKGRNIFAQEKAQAQAEAEAQKLRVLSTVRLLYYEALGAQQLIELHGQLVKIAREAVDISEQLFNVGQADQPDVLEAQIEAQRAELGFKIAENDRERIWQQLAAVVGDPSLKPTRLVGNLEEEIPMLNQEEILAALLRESPEIKKAQARVEQARADLERAQAEPTPDLLVRGAFGYNFEPLEALGGPTRLEGAIEIGVRVPLFNRNQGNIAAARAEIDRAEQEVKRLELALRANLASAFTRYLNALSMVQRYQKDILPPAQKAYELYLTRFREMAAAYPQVLIAQRTLFQVRVEYVGALVDLWQNVIQLRGLLLAGGLNAPDMSPTGGKIQTDETPGSSPGMPGPGIRKVQGQR